MYDENVAVIYLVRQKGERAPWNPVQDGWQLYTCEEHDGLVFCVYWKYRRKLTLADKRAVDEYGKPPSGWVWPRELLPSA